VVVVGRLTVLIPVSVEWTVLVLVTVIVTVVLPSPSFTATFGPFAGLAVGELQHKPTAPTTGVQVLVVESDTVVAVVEVTVTVLVSVAEVVTGGPWVGEVVVVVTVSVDGTV